MNDEVPNSDDIGVCGEDTLIKTEYDPVVTSPSAAVIEAIASVKDTDPATLSEVAGITLYDYLDPDALNRLFTHEDVDEISVTFSIDEYTVWMEGNKIAVAHTTNTSQNLE
ncbi:HalOD1 output domain-containing protein [Halorubrum sp. DTA98]|uniref:HalOD1 output domain-containing protein n=1 Tax=Halorubrum sp. DTA98 TaxID=3402163 RepID=UPI003AAEA39B